MKKKTFCFLVIVLILVSSLGLIIANREPEQCPLCNYIKSHAPCLVNVKTGEIEEMALYTPHYTLVGEIAEEQTDSTFSFVDIAGCRGTRLSSPYIMELDVPSAVSPIIKQHFCRNCRSQLAKHKGYVIADLYSPGKPVVFEINDEMHLTIRCYSVKATLNKNGETYRLVIEGNYGSNNSSYKP